MSRSQMNEPLVKKSMSLGEIRHAVNNYIGITPTPAKMNVCLRAVLKFGPDEISSSLLMIQSALAALEDGRSPTPSALIDWLLHTNALTSGSKIE